jgi:RNA polymerase sigma factor (sigma-70 family)
MTDRSSDGFTRLLAWFADDEADGQARLHEMQRDLAAFLRQRGVAPQDVDDLVQEVVMTTAIKCAHGIPNYPSAVPLMIGIARKLRLQYFRKSSMRRELQVDTLPENPVAAARPSEEAECLDSILARLSSDERTLLVEYYDSDEHERAALAKTLTVSSGALRVRVFRLKKRVDQELRDCLEGQRI